MFRGGSPASGAAAITSGTIAGATITGGTISTATINNVTGAPYVLCSTGIPVGVAPTGSMANNGAVTMGTALPTIYANCYMYFPAGAIAAGVPAAADSYYVQMSSTTVGTVFNNLQSANLDAFGMPQIPASPTAFATTGPGAFTGITSAQAVLTITIPAATQATTGAFDLDMVSSFNNSVNNKNVGITYGGTSVWNANLASNVGHRVNGRVKNANSASVNRSYFNALTTAGTVLGSQMAYLAINTASAVSVVITLTRGTATDTAQIEQIEARITK